MLYYLFEYLDKLDLPGAGVFQYISFRAAMSIITSLFFSLLVGKRIIRFIQKKQIGETIRELGLEGQYAKKGTPTMGGLIILGSILIPVLLFGDLTNIYIILMLITTVWLGFLGFLDDYIKVFKKNKEGLNGKFKILGQIGIGLIVGLTLYLNDDVVVRVKSSETITQNTEFAEQNSTRHNSSTAIFKGEDVKSTVTTIPFMNNKIKIKLPIVKIGCLLNQDFFLSSIN